MSYEPDGSSARLFTPGQIAVAALIAGPLAGCWFFASNYAALGRPRQRAQCLAWGVGGTLALLVIGYFLPRDFPPLAVPLGIAFGLYHTARIIHGPTVLAHLQAGGTRGSWGAVFRVSLLILVVLLLVLLALVQLVPLEK